MLTYRRIRFVTIECPKVSYSRALEAQLRLLDCCGACNCSYLHSFGEFKSHTINFNYILAGEYVEWSSRMGYAVHPKRWQRLEFEN